MPRRDVELPYRVTHLSILDEEGRADPELEPAIDSDLLLRLHRMMLLTRRVDERMVDLQRQGRVGTFPPVKGHEASHLGAVATLRETDWMVPAYRETGAEMWRGRSIASFLLYWSGWDEAGGIEPWRNDLPIAVPIGTQTLHAVGLGYAMRYRGTDQVVLSFFGDGATSQGDFHEAMNFSAVWQAPVIWVCQNNQWAISLPRSKQTRSETLAQKAIAYGMPGVQVDGNDVLAVYSATQEAVARARTGGGPTFIECVTYRLTMHTTADDPRRYRSDEEVRDWERKDPLPRFQKYLLGKGLLTDDSIVQVEAEIKAEIQAAVEETELLLKKGADPLHMFEHVYAELPPTLVEQREELKRELGREGEGEGEGVARSEVRDLLERAGNRMRSAGIPGPGEEVRPISSAGGLGNGKAGRLRPEQEAHLG